MLHATLGRSATIPECDHSLFIGAVCGTLTAQDFDLLIRNGHIIDRSGSAWYSGDIAVREERIAAIKT